MPLEQELILFLECQDVSVNLRLFSDAVARPEALRSATSSGAYRRGCCMLRLTDLEPNTYVLVVSTFRPGVSWRTNILRSLYAKMLVRETSD